MSGSTLNGDVGLDIARSAVVASSAVDGNVYVTTIGSVVEANSRVGAVVPGEDAPYRGLECRDGCEFLFCGPAGESNYRWESDKYDGCN